MKIAKLREVQKSLTALSKIPNKLALTTARNLRLVNEIIENAENDFKKSLDPFYVKGENGESVSFVLDVAKKQIVLEPGADGGEPKEKVFINEKETPLAKGQSTCFKFRDKAEAEKLSLAYQDTEFEFPFVPYHPPADLAEVLASGKIQADLLIPLLGNIIPDGKA